MEQKKPEHPWKARALVTIFLLLVSFGGLVVIDIFNQYGWLYWRVAIPVFAFASIGLTLYINPKQGKDFWVLLLRQALHWLALAIAVIVVSSTVKIGVVGRYEAGLEVATLLGLTTFLAGVYFEPTFLIIGALISLIVLGVALLQVYLYWVLVPLFVLAFLLILWIARKEKKVLSLAKKDVREEE